MSQQATRPDLGAPAAFPSVQQVARKYTGYWWLFLVAGIAWIVIALVILQFDQASVATVGVLIGLMFLLAAVETAAIASTDVSFRWAWALFAALFLVSAIICFVNPKDTFAGMADILGFLFLLVGLWWMVQAFLERALNPLWWLGLIGGILMTIMAFWTAGQFFVTRAYVLLVFAGVWALMQGITDIVRAFSVRRMHQEL